MGTDTGISWTSHTFNPWHGCVKVSAGCDNCYAETLSKRWGREIWGHDAPRRFFGDKHWQEPVKWNAMAQAAGVRARVFCGSMCDWAEGRPDQADARSRLFALIEATPWLDWQLLTKRPGAIPHLIPAWWLENPRPNVWFGTSVEDQEQADRRIPQLLKVSAVVRFLSCEPLLGAIDLRRWLLPTRDYYGNGGVAWRTILPSPIHWVITGGESGPHHRPFDPQWARAIKDQCRTAGVAYFHKQGAGIRSGMHTELDGREWKEFPNVARS